MKSVRLHGRNDFRIHEEARPSPGIGEALLRVEAVGICGSDIHWMIDTAIGDFVLTKPLVLGHEFSAIDTESGHLVAVDPAVPCGKCESCREGNHNLCPDVKFAGHGQLDGALTEFISWPVRNLHQLPVNFDAVDGAMLEPLGVAIYAHDLVQMHPRMQLGVFGCGPIGLLLISASQVAPSQDDCHF